MGGEDRVDGEGMKGLGGERIRERREKMVD